MASDRWVVLDDTNTSINYTGGWMIDDSGSHDQIGNFGPTYLHTLHGTSANGTVEFEFNGTAVEVWGTNIVKDPKSNPDPTFECFVDGVSVGRDSPFEFPENNWRFCSKAQLVDGHHTLRIDVKVGSQDQTFWLDQLRYIPSPNLPLDNQVIFLENTDLAIQYDSQWTSLGETAYMTTHKNSSAQVNFVGTSISWVAFVPTELPHAEATGIWAIDGGEATQFLLPGLSATSTTTIYNQIYFTTPEVEAGPHTLTVTFLGNNQTTPLCIDFIYVQNGTFPTSTSDSTTSSNNSTASTSNSATTPDQKPHDSPRPSPSKSHSGAILGGVLGGLALLVIILGAVLFRKRWKARHKVTSRYTSTPFDLDGNNHPDLTTQIHQSKSSTVPNISASKRTPLVLTPTPAQQQLKVTRKQQEALGRTVVHCPSNDQTGRTGTVGTGVPRHR